MPTLEELIAVDDLRAAADAAGAVAKSAAPDGELSFLALDHSLAKMRESSEPMAVGPTIEEAVTPTPAAASSGGSAAVTCATDCGGRGPGGGPRRRRICVALCQGQHPAGAGHARRAIESRWRGSVRRRCQPRRDAGEDIALAPGSHILELRGRGVPRVIPLQITAGAQVSQYLEFADTPTTGMLVVHSQPAGANVTVDGVARGVTPLTVEGLSSGDHEVVLQSATGTSRHTVKVLAGTTASLVAPVTPAVPVVDGPVSGWISIKAPFLIEIREDGNLIGTTETDRLMLAAGRHVLEFANQTVGYRQSRTVQVVPGKVAAMTIELPQGTVNLNASPWAEVWLDGRRIGETPIGNLAVPIGPHEIVFRHPEFGEKKHAVSVTTAAPVRLSVSMK